jgi:hypothetical protein
MTDFSKLIRMSLSYASRHICEWFDLIVAIGIQRNLHVRSSRSYRWRVCVCVCVCVFSLVGKHTYTGTWGEEEADGIPRLRHNKHVIIM